MMLLCLCIRERERERESQSQWDFQAFYRFVKIDVRYRNQCKLLYTGLFIYFRNLMERP